MAYSDTSLAEGEKLKSILKRFHAHNNTRDGWVETWQDCYDYAMPNRTGFYAHVAGQKNTDLIFDSTAVIAVQEFASRMQAGLTPPFAKWFELQAGSEVPKEQKSEVNRQLEEIALYAWEVLQASNLDQELHEGYVDLTVGTGALLVEEGDAINPIKFTAIPQTQLVLGEGPFGKIDPVYRTREMTLESIMVTWPKANIPDEMYRAAKETEQRKFQILECLKRDWIRFPCCLCKTRSSFI